MRGVGKIVGIRGVEMVQGVQGKKESDAGSGDRIGSGVPFPVPG